mgnify:CR=1 FL=1
MERIKAGARDLWQGSLCILLLWGILFRGSYAKDGILRGLTSCYQVIIPALFPFLVVSLVSTPLVYAATVWSVRLLMKLFHAKEASHD